MEGQIAPTAEEPPPSALVLETVEDDGPYLAEVQAHLDAVRSSFVKLHRRGDKKTAMELLSESMYRSAKGKDEEVDDSWFAEQEERRGIRLRVGQAQGKARAAGAQIKRIRKSKRVGGKPMVVVEESEEQEGPDDAGPGIYSPLSLVESPTGSLASLESSGDLSRTTTQTEGESSRPSTPGPTDFLRLPALATLSEHPSASSVTSSTSDASDSRSDLRRAPSRTLTLDESHPKPRRRDSRSDFTPHRKLTHLRRRDFNKVLSMHRRKLGRGAASLDDVDAALEEALAEAAGAEKEKKRAELDVLYEHQRGYAVLELSIVQ